MGKYTINKPHRKGENMNKEEIKNNGWYWMKTPSSLEPEIVRIWFNVMHKRKKKTMVKGLHFSCPLSDFNEFVIFEKVINPKF